MRPKSLVLYAGLMLMLAGCGGGDGGASGDNSAAGDTSTSSESSQSGTAAGPAPKLDAVLACMKRGGLDAQDQSSSTGAKIGVDDPAGRYRGEAHDAVLVLLARAAAATMLTRRASPSCRGSDRSGP